MSTKNLSLLRFTWRPGAICLVAALLCVLSVHRAVPERRKKAETPPKPSTPPVTHPTSLTPSPVPRAQAEKHRQRIGALKQSRPEAFPAAPERMAPSQEIEARTEAERQQGLALPILLRGNPNRREIALTFDDGPHPLFTPRLLDLLRTLHVKATFFLVGKKVDNAPYLVARILQEGHDVGNHTYDHVNLTRIPADMVETEIRLDNDAIQRACGMLPVFFRPPGGQYDLETVRIAEKLHMTTVFWTNDPADYLSPGANIIETRLLTHVRNGSVILVHDGIEQTFQILPDLVTRLRRAGYRFVTLSEMTQHLEASPFARR